MAMSGMAPSVGAGQFQRASFTGSAGEYFGIWIVNVLLTIITLGIYSAWAKVRRNRYFYGNTVILDRAFEYHATGKQIFIGRLIVVGFFIIMNILAVIVPPVAIITPIVLLIALPWLIQRGVRFSARVTSYRNVRFDFVGTAGGAFKAIILGSIIAAITFGILAPVASRWLWRYLFNNFRYGDRKFATEPRLGALYGVWFLSAAMVVIGTVIVGGIVAVVVAGASAAGEGLAGELEGFNVAAFLGIYAVAIVYFLVYGLAALFYRAGVRNVAWSAATLDGRHELLSDVSRVRYAWIVISNIILTVLTLGLMRPWAAVRMARYVNEHTAIRVNGNIGEVLSSMEASGAAISAEYMDLEGFDFGF